MSTELGKNEPFGESSLVGNTLQAAVIAKTGCRLFAISVDEFCAGR